MNLEINALQFYIIDTLWQRPASEVWYYRSPRSVAEHFGASPPPVRTTTVWLDILDELCTQRLVEVLDRRGNIIHDVSFVRRFAIRKAIDQNDALALRLTSAGDSVWNQIARPKWQMYHETRHVHNECLDCDWDEIICVTALDATQMLRVALRHAWQSCFECGVLNAGVKQLWVLDSGRELGRAYWIEIGLRQADVLREPECIVCVLPWRVVGFNRTSCESIVSDAQRKWMVEWPAAGWHAQMGDDECGTP